MTNTRLTDPEVLEFRYPVLLEDFHIRTGSGGRGEWNAGDGVRRTIRFLERWIARSCRATAACARSAWPAARPVRSAENSVRRNDGRIEKLEGCGCHRDRRRRGRHHPDADRGRIREAEITMGWRWATRTHALS